MREGRRGRDAPDRDQSRLWLSSCKDFFAQRRSCRSCTSLSAGSILYAATRPDHACLRTRTAAVYIIRSLFALPPFALFI